MNEFFVLCSGWRHRHDGALMWNVQHSLSIHFPPRVCQTCHELVQLSNKVVLDANHIKTTLYTRTVLRYAAPAVQLFK